MATSRTPRGIGSRVRQLRVAAGLTQAMLAEQTGIADATLSRIERNRLTPSVRLAEKISRALNVRVDDLFDTPKEPKKPTLRPCEAKLLALVRPFDDAAVDDITKALKLIIVAARKS